MGKNAYRHLPGAWSRWSFETVTRASELVPATRSSP
jgi:hypothetical protein